jgi:hypothetical protein
MKPAILAFLLAALCSSARAEENRVIQLKTLDGQTVQVLARDALSALSTTGFRAAEITPAGQGALLRWPQMRLGNGKWLYLNSSSNPYVICEQFGFKNAASVIRAPIGILNNLTDADTALIQRRNRDDGSFEVILEPATHGYSQIFCN